MKTRRREGGKVLYILASLSAKNAGPFYGEEVGFRIERALEDLGPKKQFYSCVLLRARSVEEIMWCRSGRCEFAEWSQHRCSIAS